MQTIVNCSKGWPLSRHWEIPWLGLQSTPAHAVFTLMHILLSVLQAHYKWECMLYRTVHNDLLSSKILTTGNTRPATVLNTGVASIIKLVIQCPRQIFLWHFQDISLTFAKFHDISLAARKFPDISRFSRQVVTLLLNDSHDNNINISNSLQLPVMHIKI